MANLCNLPAHERMTTTECLSLCARTSDEYQAVLVIGYDNDGCLSVRSSAMSRKDALWMLMAAIDYTRRVDFDG